MLNNLTNFFNLITGRMIKTTVEDTDLIPLGTKHPRYGGGYAPTAITVGNFVASLPISPLADVNVIFVSPNGDDNNAGTIGQPVKNLWKARDLAVAGDLVYVLPGTYTYDNSLANGLPYNTSPGIDRVNLWKNGVNYYFEDGAKIQFINQSGYGTTMALFRLSFGSQNETCNVYGNLEFVGTTLPGFGTLGETLLFWVVANFNYEYHSTFQIKKASSQSSAVIRIGDRNFVDPSHVSSNFDFTADTIIHTYVAGQPGQGTAIFANDIGKSYVNLKIKNLYSYSYAGVYVRQNVDLNLECDYVYGTLSVVYARAWANSKMNINIKRCDFYTQAITAAAVAIYLSNNNTVNVTGNFYDRLSADVPVFGIQGGNGNTFNFTGNVYLNYTGVGNGRTVYVDYNTNKAFLNGTVVYSGSDTLATPLNAASTGTIIFKGWMYGTFKGSVMYAPTAGGTVRYENALLEFQGTVGSQIIIPTAPCNGNLVISNSTIKVNASATPVAGQANLYVTNSQIKNFGTADVFTNAGSAGSLQLLGSTIVTDGTAKAVNFIGSAPVTIADSNSNSTATATTLNGSITTVSTINII